MVFHLFLIIMGLWEGTEKGLLKACIEDGEGRVGEKKLGTWEIKIITSTLFNYFITS